MDKKTKAIRPPNDKRSETYNPSSTEYRAIEESTKEQFGPEHPEYQRNKVRK